MPVVVSWAKAVSIEPISNRDPVNRIARTSCFTDFSFFVPIFSMGRNAAGYSRAHQFLEDGDFTGSATAQAVLRRRRTNSSCSRQASAPHLRALAMKSLAGQMRISFDKGLDRLMEA